MEKTSTRFEHFELVKQLNSGGIAEVYEAIDTRSGRRVLLRVLNESCTQNPRIRQVYEEFRASDAPRVDDPNVLRLLDCGLAQDRFYFAFEHVEGETLAQRMESGRLSTEDGLSIVRQVAEGLRGVHQRKIVHGDVKPANIYVGRDSRNQLTVKLSMVDLALSGAEAMVSVYGELVGTPKYMSPEQIEGRHVGPRSDIFSLGIVAYEMFGAREPFRVQTQLGYLRANCEREATPLAALDTSIPIEVSNVVQKMMEREPTRRYRNCQGLLDDLDRVESRMAGDLSEVVPPGTDSAFAADHPVIAQPPSSGARLFLLGSATTAAILVCALVVVLLVLFRGQGGVGTLPPSGTQAQNPPRVVTPETPSSPQIAPATPSSTGFTDPAREFEDALRLSQQDVRSGRFTVALTRYEDLAKKYATGEFHNLALNGASWVLYQKGASLEDKGTIPLAIDAYLENAKNYGATDNGKKSLEHAVTLLRGQWSKYLEDAQWDRAEAQLAVLEQVSPAAAAGFEGQLTQAWLAAAQVAIQSVDGEAAKRYLARVMAQSKDDAARRSAEALVGRANEIYGEQLLARKQYQAAYELFGQLSTPNAKSRQAEALYQWCVSLWRSPNPNEIVQCFDKWDQLNREFPNDPILEKGKTELAEMLKQREIIGKSGGVVTAPRLAIMRASSLRDAGNAADYERALENVIQQYPNTPESQQSEQLYVEALRNRASVLQAKGDEAGGRQVLETLAGKYKDSWAEQQLKAPAGMVYVPAGDFHMGLSVQQADDLAKLNGIIQVLATSYFLPMTPERVVTLPAYAIDRTEVTNAQYERFVRETNVAPPASPQWDARRVKPGFENYPVTHVTYRDAEAYAKWAGKRALTEAEWERAARGTEGYLYPWGGDFDARKANVPGSGRGDGTVPVGTVDTDRSPSGCMDMAGNVREWVSDRYLPYLGSKADPASFQPGDRIVRGGSYKGGEFPSMDCTTVARLPKNAAAKSEQLPDVGFRCAASLEEGAKP